MAIFWFYSLLYIFDVPNLEQEEYRVHSAYLVSQLCGDEHESHCPEFPIVIRAKPDVLSPAAVPVAFLMALTGLVPTGDWIHVDYFNRNLFSRPWQRRFQVPGDYWLATEAEIDVYGTPGSEKLFPGSVGYVGLSRVGFSLDRSTAYFQFDFVCGLCGGGRRVTMRKVAGEWKVEDEDWLWVS